jgi:3-aminobutyryl-CoA ammonia-lyase
MIGNKVMLRVRMSSFDARYGGDLVAGAKMLEYFGDLATELCIRSDGDEGLFLAYDSVEFLAPVYAGDYIEYYGWIESKGRTSRKMKFEAYKIIEEPRPRDPNLAESAANVLKEPVLVGRASGTLVVKAERQRGAQDPRFE